MTSSEPSAQMSDPGGLLGDIIGGVVDDAVQSWNTVVNDVTDMATNFNPALGDIDISIPSVDFGTDEASGILPGEWEAADSVDVGVDTADYVEIGVDPAQVLVPDWNVAESVDFGEVSEPFGDPEVWDVAGNVYGDSLEAEDGGVSCDGFGADLFDIF